MRDRARTLRRLPTETEQRCWQALRKLQIEGVKFRRQHLIGPYIVDFVALSHKLIIEVDGSQHITQAAYDHERTQFLVAKGYKVLRFWNNEIFQQLDAVKLAIRDAIMNTSSSF